MTFASQMQHKIYWGPLKKPIEWSLKTVLAPWAYIASVIYHDSFWYPVNAKRMMRDVLDSPWGRLFRNWETLTPDANGFPQVGEDSGEIKLTGGKALVRSLGILGTCIKRSARVPDQRRTRQARGRRSQAKSAERDDVMTDFTVRSENVDVEQIMRQIRTRIREKRGVDYTEDEIRELANVKLEKFLDPKGVRSDLLEQFRRRRRAPSRRRRTSRSTKTTLYETHRGADPLACARCSARS